MYVLIPDMKSVTPRSMFNLAPVLKRAFGLPWESWARMLRESAQLSGNYMKMYTACIMHDEMWLHGCGNVIHLSRKWPSRVPVSPLITLLSLHDVKGMRPLCIPRAALHCSWSFTPLSGPDFNMV